METWLNGFMHALQPNNLLFLLIGTGVGMVVGALPGLGPMFGVALMLPLTFGLPPETAIIFLAAVHASTAYGDSIASILINTPGGGGSIAACWDGHPLARQGKAGMALGLSSIGSFFGGAMGWLSLVLISPLLIALALRIGPPEMFMITVLALSLLAVAVKGNTIRGLIMACFGLLLSFVGQDAISGIYRFTFGTVYLQDGIDIIPVVVGTFALSQVLVMAEEGGTIAQVTTATGGVLDAFRESAKRFISIIRGGLVGIFVGILPALGISTGNVMAYLVEKRSSKEPESFGKGNPSGLLAPETAKSACVVGDLIPTFTLGIPGSPTTAILLAALVIHGLRPGADFFARGDLAYVVFSGILLAQLAFFIIGLVAAKYLAKLVLIPNSMMVPAIAVLAILGAYADSNRIEEAVLMVIFGFIGYLMKKNDYPPAALVLGLVLGDLAESNFNRSMLLYHNLSWLYTRPITLGLALLTVLSLGWPYFVDAYNWLKRKWGRSGSAASRLVS